MYTVTIQADNTGLPVSVDELKQHLRINTDDEDALLDSYLHTATELFEQSTGRSVLPRTYRQYVPALTGPIYLQRAPVSAVTGVTYTDASGTPTTATGWHSDTVSVPASVWFDGYPTTSPTAHPAAYVTFTAGWASASAVPHAVRTAIRLLAGHYYGQRESHTEASLNELPNGFRAVCDLYRTGLMGPWGAE